jgi:aminocarboxymuconate-semialdehyde decarboxylase
MPPGGLDQVQVPAGPARGCARRPSEYLRRIWFDALVYTPRALLQLVDAAGADKVVLGTDYPFDMGVTDPVARATAAALPAADLAAILSGNAASLLGLGLSRSSV